MIEVHGSTIGNDVRVRITTYDESDQLADADAAPTVTIEYGEREYATAVVSAASATNQGVGTYDYWWDTAGLSADTYTITASYEMDAHTRVMQRRHRLKAED